MKFMEILVPVISHAFSLSIVEVILNGSFMYKIKGDFASILFILSVSIILSDMRKSQTSILSTSKLVGFVSQ